MGSMLGDGAAGPGVFFVIPCIDQYRVFDLRTKVANIPVDDVLTADSLTLGVDAAIFYRITDPAKTASNVEDYAEATTLLGATTLRNRLGLSTLTQILFETHHHDDNKEIMEQLNQTTGDWGIVVDKIEIQSVRLPTDLQRSMAAEAEGTRRAKAKIIAAEGEAIASRNLAHAAAVLETKEAIELRYLQTLHQVAANDNHTVVFPLPTQLLDMLSGSEPINSPILHRFVQMFQSNDPPAYEQVAQNAVCPLTGVTIENNEAPQKTAF